MKHHYILYGSINAKEHHEFPTRPHIKKNLKKEGKKIAFIVDLNSLHIFFTIVFIFLTHFVYIFQVVFRNCWVHFLFVYSTILSHRQEECRFFFV